MEQEEIPGFEVLGRPACRHSSEEGGTRKMALTHDEPLSLPRSLITGLSELDNRFCIVLASVATEEGRETTVLI